MKYILRITLCALLPTFLFAQVERWVYQYDGGINGSDEAKSIIEGQDGNIYAAGYGHLTGTGCDVVVVSLTPSGTERWVYTYNGPGNSTDKATAIACDSVGNIYITGSSYDNNNDAIIISLTQGGVERWVYRYNGTGNGADITNAVTVGTDGNIYAGGTSFGSGTGDDCIVISVDSSGTERWVYRYDWTGGSDGANDLIYGFDYNIYAAGYSYHFATQRVFTVISIDTSGTERWTYHTQGTGVVNEAAYSIDYGSDNKIYSAGMSYLLDFSVIALDTSGTCTWDFIYGQSGVYDGANVVIYGADSKIYAGGYLSTVSNGYDLAVVSMVDNGDTSWIYRFNGTGNGNDIIQDLVFGLDNCIYGCGVCIDTISQENLFAVRLDTNGTAKWTYAYNGNAGSIDKANSIIYGSDDNVYLAGYTTDSLSDLDFIVISLDTTETGIVEENSQIKINDAIVFPTYIVGSLKFLEGKLCKIFDITGRQIHTLNPAPGIYFIEVDGKIKQKVVKVR